MRLLLAGIAVSMVFSAITNFILMMSTEQGGIQAVMHWMLGSLGWCKVVEYWDSTYCTFSTYLFYYSVVIVS